MQSFRRYTPEELERHFGERDYFRSMTSDQVTNILGYLQAKYKMNAQALETALLTGEDQRVVEQPDAAVYTHLQQSLEQQPQQDNQYYETQA